MFLSIKRVFLGTRNFLGFFFFLLVCNSKVFKTIFNGNFKDREIESNMRRGLFALVTLEK